MSKRHNYVFDPIPRNMRAWWKDLSKCEILVYHCVIVYTRSFRQESAPIAESRFEEFTGCGRARVRASLARLEQLGLLRVSRAHRKLNEYEALFPPKLTESLRPEN